MPGMLDTVLNLGLNDDVCAALSKKHGERFAYDAYRRFLVRSSGMMMHTCVNDHMQELRHGDL
jgi:pyruvate,orthophosphate dikinase